MESEHRFALRLWTGPMCKAFTLTELLVVIAIIAILAALLFPMFTSWVSQPAIGLLRRLH